MATMPVRTVSAPDTSIRDKDITSNSLYTDEVRPTGSAGAASAEALTSIPNTGHARIPGTGSGGTVYAGSNLAESADRGSEPSDRVLTKDEADRLYEENIEDEYAKREGGA